MISSDSDSLTSSPDVTSDGILQGAQCWTLAVGACRKGLWMEEATALKPSVFRTI